MTAHLRNFLMNHTN